MIIGNLIPRPCPNRAVATCTGCGRVYCEEHIKIQDNGVLCQPCITGKPMPTPVAPLPDDISAFKEGDYDLFDEEAENLEDYAKTNNPLFSSLGAAIFDDLS